MVRLSDRTIRKQIKRDNEQIEPSFFFCFLLSSLQIA